MKTTPVTPADVARSVWAVPPLSPDPEQNRRLVAHVEAGGVSTILWGGNANLFGLGTGAHAELTAAIPDWVGEDAWAIPSAGPSHGAAMDQARAIRGRGYPAAMLLPWPGARGPEGVEAGLRRFADAARTPVILYLRADGYLPPDRIARLFEDGVVVALKYAVETGDLRTDPHLDAILAEVPNDRVVSGIGEVAALDHLGAFPLAGFTAGAVCVAPRRSQAILRALQAGEHDRAAALAEPIAPLEALRAAHGPIPVIHEAVTLSGVADMGEIGPPFAPLPGLRAAIAEALAPLDERDGTLAA